MGSHRRRRIRGRRGRRAGIVVGVMLVVGAGVLVLALVRADVPSARLAAGAPAPAAPSAVPAVAVGPAAGPFDGTWVGALADPDTATVEVRITVGGPGRGIVVEVPSLRCVYRGPDPAPGATAVVDVRADPGRGAGCTDTARVRLAPAPPAGPAIERVRYDLLDSCRGTACIPRRAGGVLTAWRPGP